MLARINKRNAIVLSCQKIKDVSIYQKVRCLAHQVHNNRQSTPPFCGKYFIDTQDYPSYTLIMKKEFLINLIHFSIIPTDDWKQALRIRRFFMAVAAYTLCAPLGYVSYLAGFMEWEAIAGYVIIMLIINIILYIVFRTGLNMKQADPSLTAIQMCAAILSVMYVMYFAHESRGALLLVYVIILMFGIFRLNTRSFLYVSVFSLLTYGGDIALLHLYRPQGVNFNLEYLQWIVLALVLITLSTIGGYISSLRHNLSISKSEQAKSIEIINEMAIRDELTGINNRRHVMELLDYEKNRSLRSGNFFCLAMLDIDRFKNVNDRHGHLAGDAVLRAVATTIKTTLRNTEFCGRYGGEEFLIILTQTDIKGALIFAERVRTNIEEIQFPDLGPNFKVTVSIGLSEHQIGEDVDNIISRADEALYRAKNGGRNRVESV
jgi:diguanylate cyclase (GGDEF)-like protein